MQSYPIVEQRALDIVTRRGLWRRTREADDLPKPHAHEVLVYRVNGQLLVDNASRGASHDQVVDASHVSVVNMSTNVGVTVELKIPALDGSTFVVLATFACTVTDAATIVRNGLHNARPLLESYLRRDYRILELGQDYRSDEEISKVRREVDSRIKSLEIEEPLIEPGLRIRLAGVEVLTPEDYTAFEQKRTEQRRENVLKTEKASMDHSLDVRLQGNDQELVNVRLESELAGIAKLDDALPDARRAELLSLLRKDMQAVDFADKQREQQRYNESQRFLKDREHRDDQLRALQEHLSVVNRLLDAGHGEFIDVDRDKLTQLLGGVLDDTLAAAKAIRPDTTAPQDAIETTLEAPGGDRND